MVCSIKKEIMMCSKKIKLGLCPVCGSKAIACAPIEGLIGYVIRCSTNSCIELSGGNDFSQLAKLWNILAIKEG